MPEADLVLLHPPSVYDFRKKSIMYGPISDLVPSTPIFEMYPIGFMTISEYLQRYGYSVRIINVALRMLKNKRFCVEKLIKSLNPLAFGIDLHWLVHAQGSLELARIIKRYHPKTPIIFGGLSASYYHQELIRYPQVDYVIRGDSAEQPLLQLIKRIEQNEPPCDVPNLTWRNDDNKVKVNEFSHIPSDLDDISFDYRNIINSSIRYNDLIGHLPFQGWINYPIVAVLPWKGCINNCVICGGSAQYYKRICRRSIPSYRSPQLVAKDIGLISKYLKGPIFILDDIRQGGARYAEELLDKIREKKIKNHIAMEIFSPATREFLKMIARSIPNFNLQISPESHDEEVRKAFGKDYNNRKLEKTIEDALEVGCKRIDLFFMIGLPKQTSQSVKETIKYCEGLLGNFSKANSGRIHPYISALSPFLDPGSRAFEDPQKYGYRLFYKTLEEHRQALLQPSWKYILSYETEWMSRHEIVTSTYDAALELNRLKARFGLLKQKEAEKLEVLIKEAKQLIRWIDEIVSIKDEKLREIEMEKLRNRFNQLENSNMSRQEELRWPVRLVRFNLFRVMQAVLTRD